MTLTINDLTGTHFRQGFEFWDGSTWRRSENCWFRFGAAMVADGRTDDGGQQWRTLADDTPVRPTTCKECGEHLNDDDRRWCGPETMVCRECAMEAAGGGDNLVHVIGRTLDHGAKE